MDDVYVQAHLVDGSTHWIAWFPVQKILKGQTEGFSILHLYTGIVLTEKDEYGRKFLTPVEDETLLGDVRRKLARLN